MKDVPERDRLEHHKYLDRFIRSVNVSVHWSSNSEIRKFTLRNIMFRSKDFVGLLVHHEGYLTEQIPTGFVSATTNRGF